MIEVTLHPTPRERDVVLEQVRIVGLALRPAALVAAVVLGIVTLIIAADIVRGSAETWFDSDDWAPIGIVALLLPFAVWRGEKRFGPDFLWTLPVDRRRLALAKVFAGWVWLMAYLAVFVVWQTVLALLSRVADAEIISMHVLGGATTMYLFGSALVLGLRYPLRWIFGAVSLLIIVATLDDTAGPIHRFDAFLRSSGFSSAVQDATSGWRGLPDSAQWAILTFLWLAAGLAALWAAASRHRERRRH